MADTDTKVENEDTDSAEGEEDEEADEADSSDDSDTKDEADQQDDDYEPPQRKPWSTREERAQFFKSKKGEKLKDKDEEDQVDIAELIQQGVNKALAPVLDTLANREDDQEVREVLREHPEWKKHEKKVRKEMKVYTNVPALKLFRAHAFDDAEATGADKAKKAEGDVKKREVKGTASRSKGAESNAPDFSKMTPDQLRKFNNEIKGGKKIKIEE